MKPKISNTLIKKDSPNNLKIIKNIDIDDKVTNKKDINKKPFIPNKSSHSFKSINDKKYNTKINKQQKRNIEITISSIIPLNDEYERTYNIYNTDNIINSVEIDLDMEVKEREHKGNEMRIEDNEEI